MPTTFERNKDIEAAPLDDETVLVDPITSKFFILNKTSSFIWESLSNPTTIEIIAKDISESFSEVTLEIAREDVQRTTDEMVAENLIIGVE